MKLRKSLIATFATVLLGTSIGAIATAIPAKAADAPVFNMVGGASVRIGDGTADNPYGLRFAATMSESEYTALEKTETANLSVNYGMVVLPYNWVENETDLKTVLTKYCYESPSHDLNCEKDHAVQIRTSKLETGNAEFSGKAVMIGSLTDFYDDNRTRPFVGIGYIEWDNAGSKTYQLAAYPDGNIENCVRSMTYVAQLAQDDTTANAPTGDQKKALETAYITPYASKQTNYTVEEYLYGKDGTATLVNTLTRTATFNGTVDYAYDETNVGANYVSLAKYLRTGDGVLSSKVYANGNTVLKAYYAEEVTVSNYDKAEETDNYPEINTGWKCWEDDALVATKAKAEWLPSFEGENGVVKFTADNMNPTAFFWVDLETDVAKALVEGFDYVNFRVYVSVPGVPDGKYVMTYCEGKRTTSVQVGTWMDLCFRRDSGANITLNTMEKIEIYLNQILYRTTTTDGVTTPTTYEVVYYDDEALTLNKKTIKTTIDESFDFRANVQTFYISSIVYGKDATAPTITVTQDTLEVATQEAVDLDSMYTVSDNFTATDSLTVTTTLYKVTDGNRTPVTIENEFTEKGSYVFVIEATDANGNVATKEIAITVTGDQEAPVITKLVETAELQVGEEIDYAKWFTVTDNVDASPVLTAVWKQNGQEVTVGESISTEGEYTLTVTAKDSENNVCEPVTLAVKVVASKLLSDFSDDSDNSMIFPIDLAPSTHTSTNSTSNVASLTDKDGVTEEGLLKIVADNVQGAAVGMLGIYLDTTTVSAMGEYDYVKLRLLVQNNALNDYPDLDSTFTTVDFNNQKQGGRLNKNVPLNTWVDFYVNKADLFNVSQTTNNYGRRNITIDSAAINSGTQVTRYSFNTTSCQRLTAMQYYSTSGTNAAKKIYGVSEDAIAKLTAFTYYIDEISYGSYEENYDTTAPIMPSLGNTTKIDFSTNGKTEQKISLSANVYDNTTNCFTSFKLYALTSYTDASNYVKGDELALTNNTYTFTNKADGTTEYYVIVATATDNAGNSITKEFIVTIINSAPTA